MCRVPVLSAAALLFLAVPCASVTAQKPLVPVPVMGRTLDLRLAGGERVSGELIEAGERTLLLLGTEGLQSYSLEDINSARYQRHGFGSKQAMIWVGLGALITGTGMTVACSQVEDASCAGVFPGFALLWAAVGGGFAGYVASGQMRAIEPSASALAPYARFPQGAPSDFRARQQSLPASR